MPEPAARSLDQLIYILRYKLPSLQKKTIIAGFDGFIDTLVKPIRKYGTDGKPEFFNSIEEFGVFIADHSHRSTSIQYKILEKKPGGNMPNFVRAMDALSLRTSAVGMLSTETGNIDPLFSTLGKQRYSYLAAGTATNLEFNDGKIFLSSANLLSADMPDVSNDEKILSRILKVFPGFPDAAAVADLTAFLNWSELPFSQDLWNDIYKHAFEDAGTDKERLVFFDLSDTSTKKSSEIETLFSLIAKFSARCRTILSLNKNEALDICVKTTGKKCSVPDAAELLYRRLSIDELIVHQHTESIALTREGMTAVECVFNENPKISTGAGDHFNAAYCLAALASFTVTEKLLFANACSGAYIAKGASPGLDEIFC